ncbi:MAG: hypothetical protein ACLQL2_01750 [Methylovirgula sp.]
MALYAVGIGTSQFYRGPVTQAPTQDRPVAQQSRDLSDAVAALQAPQILMTTVRASAGTQMATLCLVQPSDTSSEAGSASPGGALDGALAAYATVLAD